MRLCRCGAIVKRRCSLCDGDDKTTLRGYDGAWKSLSERYRAAEPLCEVCTMEGRTRAADHVHHIVPVRINPAMRLDRDNLISVCEACHKAIEGKGDPRRVKV